MADETERPEETEPQVRDIEPEKDPKGGRRRAGDPCSGGE